VRANKPFTGKKALTTNRKDALHAEKQENSRGAAAATAAAAMAAAAEKAGNNEGEQKLSFLLTGKTEIYKEPFGVLLCADF
jgi:hypothetical protein